MIQTVVKRDGRIVGFNEQKIMAAIRKAMISTEKGEDDSLLQTITDRIAARGSAQMTVEQIQDSVEMELMKSSRKDVAQRYIAYRNQRSIARKAKTRDVFLDIVNIKNNDVTRENANMNADTPAGMMMKFASETTKPFVDDYLLSPESAMPWSTTICTSTTRTTIPRSPSPAVSILSTIFSLKVLLPDMAPAVLLSALRLLPYWLVSLWNVHKTKCMADRLFLPSISIWLHTYAYRI